METKMLCSDEDAQKLLHDSQISLLQLSTVEVATQLSMRNFELFCSIEPTEYIDDLFKLKSKTSCANLKTFEEVINQETFWVATENLRETNQLKRMKIIKHFIKIELQCQECKNFNSMFAIIRKIYSWNFAHSGLFGQLATVSKVTVCLHCPARLLPYFEPVEKNMQKVEEEGEIVMVKEHRELDGTGTRKGHIVLKGTSERLIMHLVEEHSVEDPTFIEVFLLTYRTFLSSPMEVAKKLLEWFNDPSLRDKVTQVVLLWVNNHFNDFEEDPAMMRFLEEFENNLEREKMGGHLRLLNITCAAKAKCKLMTLTKPSHEAPLPFILLGGSEKGFGIFVDSVESGSKATEAGLKRGDQILEVNGQNFENIQLSKAMEILRNNTHLSITVKTNLFVFKELLTRLSEEKRNGAPHLPKIGDITKTSCYSIPDLAIDVEQVIGLEKVNKKSKANTVGGRNKLKKIFDRPRISVLLQKPYNDIGIGQSQDDSIVGLRQNKDIPAALSVIRTLSSSNSDLLQSLHQTLDISTTPDLPDQVLRVFKADQQSRYIMISKHTTAKEVVIQAIRKFSITTTPDQYSLCEVSVMPEGVIKQRQLPDQLSKLADRIQLSGRYYLKNNMETKMLCSDEDAQKLLRDSQISLLQLSTVEVATQLSMRNFELFCSIEPTEYIDDLFKLKSKTSCANLKTFEEVINQETFWVATEILRETNQLKRMKIIKHFIKIALHCRECKNFNSMFAIISGLNLAPVARLRATWENLPNKYERLFQDLQDLFDPSRNMAKYRNVLSSQNLQTPVIPLFPIIKKDLTFLQEGNDSKVDGLVNFEKLRMIAKEIRHVGQMASVNMDPALMFRTRKKKKWCCLGSLSQGSTNATVLDVAQNGRHKKQVRHRSFLNAKKLYEDAQMARKVKQYLSNLEVEMDEESLRTVSLQYEPATRTLPRNPGDKKPVKSKTSPVAPRAGPQQKVQSQQLLPQPPHKVSQGLQVPAVSLYPSRKKLQVKDLPPFGYSLDPSGNVDNFSGSGHSEISSRSSIVSNSSFDLVPVPLHDEWRQMHSISIVETNLGLGRMELQTMIEPDQYSLGSYAPVSESRGLYTSATVISSPSTEELSHDQRDRASLNVADSGHGSWMSCSSSSHDNIQIIQHQRSWETLPVGHTHFDYSGDAAGIWDSFSHMDQITFSDHSTQYHRQNQIRESLEQAQSRATWTTSTGHRGEDSEGDMGTIKWSGGKDVSIEAKSRSLVPVTTKEAIPFPMPAHIDMMLSTTRGLIEDGQVSVVWGSAGFMIHRANRLKESTRRRLKHWSLGTHILRMVDQFASFPVLKQYGASSPSFFSPLYVKYCEQITLALCRPYCLSCTVQQTLSCCSHITQYHSIFRDHHKVSPSGCTSPRLEGVFNLSLRFQPSPSPQSHLEDEKKLAFEQLGVLNTPRKTKTDMKSFEYRARPLVYNILIFFKKE